MDTASSVIIKIKTPETEKKEKKMTETTTQKKGRKRKVKRVFKIEQGTFIVEFG